MRSVFRILPYLFIAFLFSYDQPTLSKHPWKKFETHDFSIEFPQEFELNNLTVDPTRRIYIFKSLAEKSDTFNIQQIDMGVLVDTMINMGKPISYKDYDTLAYYWMKWDTTYQVVCDLIMFDNDNYNHIHIGTNIRFERHLKSCTSSRKKNNKSFCFYFQCNEDVFENKYPLGLEIYRTFKIK